MIQIRWKLLQRILLHFSQKWIIKKLNIFFPLSLYKHKYNQMEYIKEIRHGVDAGYGAHCNFHPANGEGRKGKHGLDQNLTLEEVIKIARSMEEKPNIIIKSGEKAKWYLKRYTMEELPAEIEKQQWRDTSKCTMYILHPLLGKVEQNATV
jgi:hypothetical protein